MSKEEIRVSYTEEFKSIKAMEDEIKHAEKTIVYLVEKKQSLIDGIGYAQNVLGWKK